jgi:hypothetical protein
MFQFYLGNKNFSIIENDERVFKNFYESPERNLIINTNSTKIFCGSFCGYGN